MKVGLIIPNNIWFCPYLNIYVDVLKEHHIDYDIISWDRDGRDPKVGYQYSVQPKMKNNITKIIGYIKFANFVKGILNHNHFDKLVVFTPQIGIFLAGYLAKHYNQKYIFDFRDLSLEQKSFFKKPFSKLLHHSFANCVSSPGFLKRLPNDVDYILSHNFNIQTVLSALKIVPKGIQKSSNVNVLTIGGIRDYTSNAEIISSLANKDGIVMQFVGRGHAAASLESFAKSLDAKNIKFEGYYPKEKEPKYIEDCTFLNIFYPKIISHSTALSNRFYNALIFKRPMIVTKGGIQGDYVEKYQLGLAVDDCVSLDQKIDSFLKDFDFDVFTNRCNSLLSEFVKDYNRFDDCLKRFLEY